MNNGRMDNGQADETFDAEDAVMSQESNIAGADDWREQVLVEHNNETAMQQPFESAKTLMRAVFEAVEAGEPLRGIQISSDNLDMLRTLVETGFATRDEITDRLGVTTAGRTFIGVMPDGVLDLPVEVAEVTGNIAESELAARYMDGKVAAIDKALTMGDEPTYGRTVTWRESYEMMAITLRAAADEFRQCLHTPSSAVHGRIERYNDDRSTGVSHANNLTIFFNDVHQRNVNAGWWTDLDTGQAKKRSVGEMLILMVTEMAEAYRAWLDDAADDKLPQYPGVGVEMADLLIRLADFCGALTVGAICAPDPANNPGDLMFREIVEIAERYEAIRKTPEAVGEPETADFLPPMDVAEMTDVKLAFNAQRPDHKIENRLKDDGKRT